MPVRLTRIHHAVTQPSAGAACILSAAALWGTTGTAQALAPAGAGPASVAAVRIVLGGMLLFALAAPGDGLRRLLGRGRAAWMVLALGSACVASYQVCYFAGVAQTGVAVGTIVTIGSAPVFAGVLSRLIFGTELTRRWILSTAGAVAGCAALVVPGQTVGVGPLGVALALLAGLGYSIYAICAAHLIGKGASGRAVIGALFGGGGVLLAPLLLSAPAGWLLDVRGLGLALHLAVVTTAAAYLLYARGLRTTPVAKATTLTLVEPLVAALLGLAVLGERLSHLGVAGVVLLGLSLALLMPTRRS